MDATIITETIRARLRAQQRAARHARLDALHGKLAEVRRARADWGISTEGSATASVGHQHPGYAAAGLVRAAMNEAQLGPVEVQYKHMRRTSGYGSFGVREGEVWVTATFASVSGPKHSIDVPVMVHGGRLLAPSVFIHNGETRVLTRAALEDVRKGGEFLRTVPDRAHMFAFPAAGETPGRSVALTHPGLFRAAFYAPDTAEHLDDAGDGLHIDVAERPIRGEFAPLQEVKATRAITARGRGGAIAEVPKGTPGVVLRDVDGAQRAYVVRFPIGVVTVAAAAIRCA